MKYSLGTILFLVFKISFSQVTFYQDVFKGGVSTYTAGNSISGLGSISNLILETNIPSGSTINKAFFFIASDANDTASVEINGAEFILNKDCAVTNIFNSFTVDNTSYPNSSIYCVDLTHFITPQTQSLNYKLTEYTSDLTYSRFSSGTLYVSYYNSSLPKIATTVMLNNEDVESNKRFSITNINPINNLYPVTLSIVSSYICNTSYDGSYVFIGNNELGLIGGKDANTVYSCSGVYGCFAHYNNTSFGLDDDTPDSLMNGTDALADIKSYVNNGDISLDVDISFQSPNLPQAEPLSNSVRYLVMAYSTKCDTLKSRINISDTTICAGEVLNLTVGGDSTYSYAWRYRGNVVTTDSILTITPEENRLYSIMVSDTNGCSKTEIINIKVNQKPRLFISKQDADCPNNNGAIVIDSVQGIAAPYRYRKDLGSWQTAPVYGGLSTGNYTINAIDTNSCMATEVVTINEINNTVANFSYESPLPFVPTEVTFTNQSLNASEYQWFVNGDLVSNQTNLAQLFELAGAYTITLVASKFNEQCTDTLVKTINLERENYMYLPSTWGKESPLALYSIGYVKVAFRLLNGLGQVVHVVSSPIISEEQNLLGNKNFARGVYFYELTATKVTGEEVKLGGKLIRM